MYKRDTFTLLDALTYNTHMYRYFASCEVLYPVSAQSRRDNLSDNACRDTSESMKVCIHCI